jgi:hypothetical protein
MSRSLTPLSLVGLLVLMSACSTPRKACRRADRLVAKAVYQCPDILRAKTDTVYVQLPGDTLLAEVQWSDSLVDTDSLLAACDSLRRAVEVLALNSLNQSERLQDKVTRMRRVNDAAARLQREACRVEPLEIDRTDFTLKVWQDPSTGKLNAQVNVRPRTVPCPETTIQVNPGNATVTGVARWYQLGFWLLLLVIVTYLVARFIPWVNGLPR